MAHIEKFQQHALGHMLKHFERAKDKEGKHINYGNQNIDLTRTVLNYNLAPSRQNLYGFILDRCKQVFCLKRNDVNLMCSCIVTAPKDLFETEYRLFFKSVYDFLVSRYGGKDAENVISAYVHMDEGRPHIHFAWVPVAYDEEKERWTVSAKKVVTRQDLRTLHQDLENHVKRELGHDVHILTGELSNRPNLSLPQYQALQEAKKQLKSIEETLDDMERNLTAINAEIEPKRAYLQELAQQQIAVNEEVREKNHLWGTKTVEMPTRKWEETKMTYADRKAAQELYDCALEMIQAFQSSIAGEKFRALKQELEDIRKSMEIYRTTNAHLEAEIDRANRVFKANPEVWQMFVAARDVLESQERDEIVDLDNEI